MTKTPDTTNTATVSQVMLRAELSPRNTPTSNNAIDANATNTSGKATPSVYATGTV